MTGCVQCRRSLSRPPNAFFIAPVVVVKTWVFTVGRWTMFSPRKRRGIVEAVGIDLVQDQELVGEVAHRLAHRDPLLALVEVDVAQAVLLDHRELLVLALAEMGVDHHGAVVAAVDQRRVEAVALHGGDHAVELPRRGGAARIEEVPGDVDLERGVDALVEHLLVARQVEQLVVVREHRARRGPQQGDGGLAHRGMLPDDVTRSLATCSRPGGRQRRGGRA